jgi:hypothetical protein
MFFNYFKYIEFSRVFWTNVDYKRQPFEKLSRVFEANYSKVNWNQLEMDLFVPVSSEEPSQALKAKS